MANFGLINDSKYSISEQEISLPKILGTKYNLPLKIIKAHVVVVVVVVVIVVNIGTVLFLQVML
jgi:hypothetical protein